MSELRIGNGYLTNVIYIGSVRTYKDGHQEWQDNRVEVTKDAVNAVIEHIWRLKKAKDLEYFKEIDGKKYRLTLVEMDEPKSEGAVE